jgi:hypothetical protein
MKKLLICLVVLFAVPLVADQVFKKGYRGEELLIAFPHVVADLDGECIRTTGNSGAGGCTTAFTHFYNVDAWVITRTTATQTVAAPSTYDCDIEVYIDSAAPSGAVDMEFPDSAGGTIVDVAQPDIQVPAGSLIQGRLNDGAGGVCGVATDPTFEVKYWGYRN